MKLSVDRIQKDPDVTIGRLSINGKFECYTLEDAVRPDGVKIFGETAIPAGKYSVDITFSPRFQRPLPLLINVAGYLGVRIHTGNTAADTEGCILVGQEQLPKAIGHSRLAFDALFAKLQAAKSRGEPITMEILA